MLSIPHATAGAFIAAHIPHPEIYIPAAIALHYVCDWIPHWDVGTGLSSGKRSIATAIKLEFIDLALTGALIYFLWQADSPVFLYHVWLGAFAGLLPDFLEAPRNFWNWEPFFLKPINKFHAMFHHSTPNMLVGLTPQVVLILVMIIFR